tara:strand:- start:2671 stop:3567 length:897 start_codon:yes stop_codon:yes gene_type:complete
MLPDIPNFNLGDVYVLTGKTLEKIVRRIQMQTPIQGANMRLEETNSGILLHADQQVQVAPTVAINHDFKATLASTDTLDITAGKVIGTTWGTPTMSAPLPTDWLAEQYTVGPSTLSVSSGSSVWLRIQCSQTDVEMEGTLSSTGATTITITTGGGGAGGDGAGGGAGGDGYVGESGSVGADATGQTPGAAGTFHLGGTTAGGENSGTPANGGDGGDGGAGGNGETKSFSQYTKLLMVFRRWQITSASLEVHSTKPTAAPATNIYIRIASQTGGVVTQYHAGSYHIALPATTYISSLVP